VNPATAEQIQAPRADAMEVLMTLSLRQYDEMGDDLEAIRRKLDLPVSASTTQIILDAVHRLAEQG
jgi:hypothetical protein